MIHVGFFLLFVVLSAVYIFLCELTFPKEHRLWYNNEKGN